MLPFVSPVAAQRAADACRAAAAVLRDCTEDRARLAAVACTDWRGPRRAAFDDDLAALTGGGEALEAGLRRLAGALDDVAGGLRHEP